MPPQEPPSPHGLVAEVRALFEEPRVSTEVASRYFENLSQNLTTTEKAIGSGFLRITLALIAFLLLDSGLFEKVAVAGAELKRSGVLLLIFPLIIAFLTYQLNSRITFAHELRTTIALLYSHLAPAIYSGGLDLLMHYPSVRNIESYYGKLVCGRGKHLLEFSTTVLTVVMGFAPFVAVAYCLFRTFISPGVSLWPWLVAVLIAGIFLFRALVLDFFVPFGRNEEYYKRARPRGGSEEGK